MPETTAVTAMAYGTPADLGDIERYYTDIRGGRPPTYEQLADLTERYRSIGGSSPLLEITRAQAAGLHQRLGIPVYLGMKHSRPFVGDAVQQMARDGIDRAVGLVLAPHYSTMSVGDYAARAEKAAADVGWPGRIEVIPQWHLEPGYLEFLARAVTDAVAVLPAGVRTETIVVFTAHSLPEKIVGSGDPYPEQLEETAGAVAASAQLSHWRTAWQSAGRTREPWLRPDLIEVMRDAAASDASVVVVCPCGFVADHLEVLYDVDIDAARVAGELGLGFARTASPNADPAFLDTLATVVKKALAEQP